MKNCTENFKPLIQVILTRLLTLGLFIKTLSVRECRGDIRQFLRTATSELLYEAFGITELMPWNGSCNLFCALHIVLHSSFIPWSWVLKAFLKMEFCVKCLCGSQVCLRNKGSLLRLKHLSAEEVGINAAKKNSISVLK